MANPVTVNPMCIQIGISLDCSLHLPATWLTQGVEGTMVKSTMGAKSQVDRDRHGSYWKSCSLIGFCSFLKGTNLTNCSHEHVFEALEKQQKVATLARQTRPNWKTLPNV